MADHKNPFTHIVAQQTDKISPARQEFQHFRHFPRFIHASRCYLQKILADFTKSLQISVTAFGAINM